MSSEPSFGAPGGHIFGVRPMPDAQLKPKGCPFGNNYRFCTGEPPIGIFLGVLVLSRLDPKAQSEYRSDFVF